MLKECLVTAVGHATDHPQKWDWGDGHQGFGVEALECVSLFLLVSQSEMPDKTGL